MRRIAIIGTLVLLAIGYLAWRYSPTQVVKRRTRNLYNTLTIHSNEAAADRNLHALSLGAFLEKSVRFETHHIADLPDEIDRGDIEDMFSYVCKEAVSTEVSANDYELIDVTGDQAHVITNNKIRIDLPGAGALAVNGTHRVELFWHHSDQGWRLSSATWTKTGP